MSTKVSFRLQAALVLVSLLSLWRVYAAPPDLLERHQEFLAVANRGRRRDFEVHPYSVFQDSFEYLWEHLGDFRCDPLGNVKFVDDAAMDPIRWVHLMTAWIFGPSSQLFQRGEDPYEDGNLVYSIYTGEGGRGEKEQLEYLRVAGRFVGKLLQEGLVLNQQFDPAVYTRLSEAPLNADNLPQGQTLAESRLAEFVAGIRDVVTMDVLVGVERSDLVRFMHGIPFEELGDWMPRVTVKPSQSNPPTLHFFNMLEHIISNLDRGLVPKLWKLVTGMDRVPLREFLEQKGLYVTSFANLDFGLGGFDVDPSQRLLYLSPVLEQIMLPVLLEPSNFESVVGYYWLKHGLERVSASRAQSKIKVDLDSTSLLETLSPIVEDVAHFTASTIILTGNFVFTDVLEHQFFTIALPRIVGPSCGLFRRVEGPEAPRPIVDLCPRTVPDEAHHLRHLNVAGMVFGKAIREFFPFPVAFSDRLYELICTQTGPALKRENSEEGTRLDARYAAFVGGIHKVVPSWMLSPLSPDCLAEIFGSSRWNSLAMRLLISRVSFLSPDTDEDKKAFFSNAVDNFRALLSSPNFFPSQLSALFWHLFARPISMEVLFARLPVLSTFNFSVTPAAPGYISISRGRLTISGAEGLVPFSSLISVALQPSHLVTVASGKDDTGEEMRVITARMGHIFQSFFEIYKQEGEERFIQQESRLVVTNDRTDITDTDSLDRQVFFILTEVCGPGRKPFVYTLQHGRGSYDIDEGEVEEGEEVHLEKLRLIGIMLARSTITFGRKTILPLSPRLQRLTYWGKGVGEERPPSLREEAFLGGFHMIAPLDAIQLLSCQEWYDYLDADPGHLSVQGRASTSHNFVLKLSQALFITDGDGDEVEEFTTWEEYVQYVGEHTDDLAICGYGLSEQLRDFIGMAFEEERGLFVVEGGKHVLRESVVEDEEKHLQVLRAVGLLVGKSIQWAHPVDFALHESIYFCLRNHGIYPDDFNPSELMKGRISAFVRGVFAVVSPIVFGLLTEQQIALLFEWQLPLNAEAVRRRDLEPAMEPGSVGEQVLDTFWGAIESFPAAAKSQILRFITGTVQFPGKGIEDTPKLALVAIPTEGAPMFPQIYPNQQQIQIPLFNSAAACKWWLFSLLDRQSYPSIQRFVRLAKIGFKERLIFARAQCEVDNDTFELEIARQNLFSAVHNLYLQAPTSFSPGKWTIRFTREGWLEEAQDAGGVFREWIRDIVADMLSPDYLLFSASGESKGACHIFPDATSEEEKRALTEYELAGVIFGKAFLEGLPVGIRFAPIIYMLMLHDGSLDSFDYMKALQELDPKAYEGLAYVRDNAVDGLELYFEARDSKGTSDALVQDVEVHGPEGAPNQTAQEVHDPEGPSQQLAQETEAIAVTEENKGEYVMLRAESILLGKTSASVEAFIMGFHVTAPLSQLHAYMFTIDEIENVLYGRDSIDVDEWERVAVYPEGEKPSCELIEWFWAIMREFTPERRRQMLFFTTSLSRVPIDGFEGIPEGKFTIEMASNPNPEALPESQTCFSTLKLHPYESKEEMKEKLEKALDWAPKGFGTA